MPPPLCSEDAILVQSRGPPSQPAAPLLRIQDAHTADCSTSVRWERAAGAPLSTRYCTQLLTAFTAAASCFDIRCHRDAMQDARVVLWVVSQIMCTAVGQLASAVCQSISYLLPYDASPMFSISLGSNRSFADLTLEGTGDAAMVHWIRILQLDRGSPSLAYEAFFEVLLRILAADGAALAATRLCGAAKGIGYLFLATRTTSTPSNGPRWLVAAASALNVPLGRIELLVTLMNDAENKELFFSWALRCWLQFLAAHLSAFVETLMLGLDEGELLQTGKRKSTTITVSCTGGNTEAHPLLCHRDIDESLRLQFSHYLRVGSTRDGVFDASEGMPGMQRHWELLRAARLNVLPFYRAIFVGLDASDFLGERLWTPPPWTMMLLPRHFVRLGEAAVPLLLSVTPSMADAEQQVDEDERSCFAFVNDEYFFASCGGGGGDSTREIRSNRRRQRCLIEYRQLSLPNKVRMLLMGMHLMFAEASDSSGHPSIHSSGSHVDSVDVLVDARCSLLTFVSPSAFTWLWCTAHTAMETILAPRIQAAARALFSAHAVVAPRRRRVIDRRVTVLQSFLRSRSSMRKTCYRDMAVQVSRLDELVVRNHSNPQHEFTLNRSQRSFLVRDEVGFATTRARDAASPPPLPRSLPHTRQLLMGLQALERRARWLTVEDEQATRKSIISGAVSEYCPFWALSHHERLAREEIELVNIANRGQCVGLEEQALRERLLFLQNKSLGTLLNRTMNIRKEVVQAWETRHRLLIEGEWDSQKREISESFNLMQQLNQLSELHTGLSLRQTLDRERVLTEQPFQHRDLFVAPSDAPTGHITKVVSPHHAKQRQRFLAHVLETIGNLLTVERQSRASLLRTEVLGHCRTSEVSDRAVHSKQQSFHFSKIRIQFQREFVEICEKCERVRLFSWWHMFREETEGRMLLCHNQLLLRQLLHQLATHQLGLLQKSAEDWCAVAADRYQSPGVLLAQLRKEQRQVQQLLGSIHSAEARDHVQRAETLRRGGRSSSSQVVRHQGDTRRSTVPFVQK